MPTKLYIGNIPSSVSSTELKELFEKYGKVLECDIVKDYAFVVRPAERELFEDHDRLFLSL
jgi:RNA recognition motif-containing protein